MAFSDRTFKAGLARAPRFGLFQTLRDVQVAGLLARAGWDFLLIDTEHFAVNAETLHYLVLAARARGLGAVVRLRDLERSTVQSALETGPDGVLAPLCDSPEEAARFVDFARYPPQGSRGAHATTEASDFGREELAPYIRRANQELLVGVQIETRAGLEACERIAAVPGLDLVFVGTGDLSVQLGQPGAGDSPELREAVRRVATAARSAGVLSGLYSSRAPMIQFALDEGVHFFACGSDGSTLGKASVLQYQSLQGGAALHPDDPAR